LGASYTSAESQNPALLRFPRFALNLGEVQDAGLQEIKQEPYGPQDLDAHGPGDHVGQPVVHGQEYLVSCAQLKI